MTNFGHARDEPSGIVDAMLLENFGDDWDSRVNWVRNHKHESFGCDGGNSGGEIADDSGIDLSITGSGRRVRQFHVFSVFDSGAERMEADKP